jgi:alkanesulfonate monooxygenase SsuD/methylene tetrahydromethanopterin reductase-like flavin-dependent oxidoreductase (luciferase family)
VDKVAAAAACAEAAGFDSVWIPDSQLLWRRLKGGLVWTITPWAGPVR